MQHGLSMRTWGMLVEIMSWHRLLLQGTGHPEGCVEAFDCQILNTVATQAAC